jgi:hypothetical protein
VLRAGEAGWGCGLGASRCRNALIAAQPETTPNASAAAIVKNRTSELINALKLPALL